MSPRGGGEADKIGNAYERDWTVRNMLLVVSGEWDSIAIEKGDGSSEGAEFILKRHGSTEVHQVKRQRAMQTKWSVAALASEGVWAAARQHVLAGRQFVFVSMTPSPPIHELAERARRVDSASEFAGVQLTNADLRRAFEDLCSSRVFGDPATSWEVLRGFRYVVHDHVELQRTNEAFCNVLFDGANGRLAAAAIGEIAANRLGVTHTASSIAAAAAELGVIIAARDHTRLAADAESARRRWLATIGDELLEPSIPRREVREAFAALDAHDLVFLVGSAGSGKSAVSYQLAHAAVAADVPTLGLRLDRIGEVATTSELGQALGLPGSPVGGLGVTAGDSPSLLIVDQLDAASFISGRMPGVFDVVAELVREAKAFPRMRIALVCREFDLANDERFRALADHEKAGRVRVDALGADEVSQALDSLGVDPSTLSTTQLEMLRSPLNLTLFARTREDGEQPAWASQTDLFDAFWDRKRRDAQQRRPNVRFAAVIDRLAHTISTQGRLAVPYSVFDADELDPDALVLVSEQVLVKDGRLVAFFHESFFDYAFARAWVNQSESLTGFLLSGEQELFVRGQVRQILTYLRATDPRRFLRELKVVIASQQVRFHVKETALRVFINLTDPSSADVEYLLALLEEPSLSQRVSSAIVRPAWVTILDTAGVLTSWLDSGDEARADWLGRAVRTLCEVNTLRAIYYLQQLRGESRDLALLHATRVDGMCASPEFQDMIVAAVKRGELVGSPRALWYFLEGKTTVAPEFCLRVLRAFLTEQPGAWDLNKTKQVAVIDRYEHGLDDVIEEVASATPSQFVQFVVPYLTEVCRLTAMSDLGGRVLDHHFAWRNRSDGGRDQVDEALMDQCIEAFQALRDCDEPWLAELLDVMAESDLATIQVLLYEALKANPERYAQHARDLLMQGGARLISGYSDGVVWLSAELIRAIMPYLDDDDINRIEDVVRDFRFPKEHLPQGRYAFSLLGAIPADRRTPLGRRRYAEYQRVFGEHPPEPTGIETGFIRSPISSDRAAKMNDHHWLRAMTKHDKHDVRNWSRFTGGASELSQVLKTETIADPARFAALALNVDEEINPAYAAAILLGLGEADPVSDPSVIFSAVEHLADLKSVETDRWLGYAVRLYPDDVPLSTFQCLVERAIESLDPAADRRVKSIESNDERWRDDVYSFGLNTARGSLADDIADLVIRDAQHERTDAAVPAITKLAVDPILGVRVFAARLVHAAMRDRPDVALPSARDLLDLDEGALAFRNVVAMVLGLGQRDAASVDEIIRSALGSENFGVRRSAGILAGYAAAWWRNTTHLKAVLRSDDEHARAGLAVVCADRYVGGSDNETAIRRALLTLANDESELVRKETAEVILGLRDQPLRAHADLIKSMIESPTFPLFASQLQITLERSLDRVDDLVCLAVRRLVEGHRSDTSDVHASIAADGHEYAELIVRSLAQADDPADRAELLDSLDILLRIDPYGVEELIAQAER